jgi:hypothetical protein
VADAEWLHNAGVDFFNDLNADLEHSCNKKIYPFVIPYFPGNYFLSGRFVNCVVILAGFHHFTYIVNRLPIFSEALPHFAHLRIKLLKKEKGEKIFSASCWSAWAKN